MMSIRNLICFSLVLAMASIANATLTLTLSTHANDDKGNVSNPDLFDATLDFSVLGTELTLTVFNKTPEESGDPELKINQVYFNVSDNVEDLILFEVGGLPPAEWVGDFNKDKILVGNFGKFDVSITDGTGSDPDVIGPGGMLTFKFNITGTGPFLDTDFIELSKFQGGHIVSYAAAKFYNGDQPGISGYGATNIPEPATIALLGLGGLALLRRRKH